MELSPDEKKLYFNSTFIKKVGKIQNGFYEICADITKLKENNLN